VPHEELRPGLWTWTAPHPEWTPDQGGPDGWDEIVRCYAHADVLIDPLDPPGELRSRAAAVLLTVWCHERSAQELGLPIRVPPDGEHPVAGAEPYAAGDALPGGVEAVVGFYPNEPLLWIPELGALVAGDILLGDGNGGLRLEPESWMPKGTTARAAAGGLRHLLDLPIELLLPTHGDPVVEDAHARLAQALA
jgi:hypothetical protein